MIRVLLVYTVGGLVILGGYAYCQYVRSLVTRHVKEVMSHPDVAKSLTPEQRKAVESDTALEEFGIELPAMVLNQVFVADLLHKFWLFWVILVILTCSGVAYFVTPRISPPG